jgi:hypothetical protein
MDSISIIPNISRNSIGIYPKITRDSIYHKSLYFYSVSMQPLPHNMYISNGNYSSIQIFDHSNISI